MEDILKLEKQLESLQNTCNYAKAQELFLKIRKLKKQGVRLGNAQ